MFRVEARHAESAVVFDLQLFAVLPLIAGLRLAALKDLRVIFEEADEAALVFLSFSLPDIPRCHFKTGFTYRPREAVFLPYWIAGLLIYKCPDNTIVKLRCNT